MDLLFINGGHRNTHQLPRILATICYNSTHFTQATSNGYHRSNCRKSMWLVIPILPPDTEIIVSVGNNDVVPDYYLQLTEEDSPLGHVYNHSMTAGDAGMLGVLYRSLSSTTANNTATESSSNTKAILNANDEWTFLRGGYYSRMFHDGKLILLSLNTVLYSNNYAPQSMYPNDPGKQFLWMRKMLDYSRDRNCQVIILGHIPPSIGSYRHTQLW